MSAGIPERMGGRMGHGFYATIVAVAEQLGLTYQSAQKKLRAEWEAGNLERQWIGRRLAYTSKQLALLRVDSPRRAPKKRGTGRRAVRRAIEENQESLF